MSDREYGFRTRAIHAGNIPDPVTGARALPIYQSTAFVFDDTADAAARFALQKYGNIYSRLANPTVASFEERVASLEGGLGAVATASGLSAQYITFASLAGAGDHIVASAALYGGSITQLDVTLRRFGMIAARADSVGVRSVVLGGADDADIAEEVVGAAVAAGASPGSVRSVAGRADLGQLVGLLARAAVLVGNDSGPRHLAQAVGCPTVGLYWAGNLINAGPLGRTLHRIQLDWRTTCPVCGIDVTQVGWKAERCAHDPSFLTSIEVDAVWADVEALM